MVHSIKQLYGDKLGALDGDIGHVKDFYFDDRSWALRYLVADTGSWLTGRQVLIAPHAFVRTDPSQRVLTVSLTRDQIENSPSIDTHKPVSRQYEEEYYNWSIVEVVIKIGHRFSGIEVKLPTRSVVRISYEDSTVFLNVSKETVEQSPAFHPAPEIAAR